jgi:hypothetical protein
MPERRREPRKNLASYSQVFDLHGGVLLGYLADLNLSGLMVIGSRPLDEVTTLTLQIEVPEAAGRQIRRLAVPARKVWSEPDLSPEYFNIGFEFLEVSPEQGEVLQAILDNCEFQRQMPDYPFRASTKPR